MAAIESAIPLLMLKPFPALMSRHLCGPETARNIGLTKKVPLLSRDLFLLLILIARGLDGVVRSVSADFSISRFLTRVLGYHLMSRLLMDQTRPLKLPAHLLSHANKTISAWNYDPKAPLWINRLEDRMTQPGPGMNPPKVRRLLKLGKGGPVAVWRKLRHALLLVLIWVLMGVTSVSWAAPLALSDSNPMMQAWPAVTVLFDPSKELGIADVQEAAHRFAAPETAHGTLGMQKEAVWLRIPISVSSESNGLWALDIDYQPLNHIEIYVIHDKTIVDHRRPGYAWQFRGLCTAPRTQSFTHVWTEAIPRHQL